jgi:predicted PurR-regulated permease PerM
MAKRSAQATPVVPGNAERKPSGAIEPDVQMDSTPTSPLTAGVVVLGVLAVIAALYFGKEVILPIALAILLKLLLQPILDFLCSVLRLPTTIGALILICGLFAGLVAVGFTVSGPASGWIQKVPEVLPALKQKLVLLRQPIEYMQKSFKEIEEVATAPAGGNEKPPPVAVKDQSGIVGTLAAGTLTATARLLSTMVILFFLLAAGDRLLRGFIEVLPSFSDKRRAIDIASEIQHQIGGYLVTITLMNLAVGVVTGLAMWAFGLGDPILWGSVAFLLNYVPILGPLTGIGLFLLVGIVTLEWPWPALAPALIYTLIHLVEGEGITPMLLAKRFTLNPVLVIVSLFFWHALWGIPGALLAVPLLAMFKIICDRVDPLKPAGHIIGA